MDGKSTGAGDPVAQVRSIVLRQLEGVSCRVYLFGSFARGAAHSSSDIDVAVDADGRLPSRLLGMV